MPLGPKILLGRPPLASLLMSWSMGRKPCCPLNLNTTLKDGGIIGSRYHKETKRNISPAKWVR